MRARSSQDAVTALTVIGARPQFIACSATIANPGTFVCTLIGQDVEEVEQSGAPAADRNFSFLNPTLSPYTVAARLFTRAIQSGLKTIVFTRARKITELITTWVLDEAPARRLRHEVHEQRLRNADVDKRYGRPFEPPGDPAPFVLHLLQERPRRQPASAAVAVRSPPAVRPTAFPPRSPRRQRVRRRFRSR